MTSLDGAFAYSQARIQARLGARPSGDDWQRIRATRDFATLLQAASATPLLAATHGLSAQSNVHDAERALRGRWIDGVEEVAAWQRPDWREAMLWMRWLPYLPSLDKLARAGRPPDWMRTDALLGPIVAVDPRLRGATLKRTELAPLADGFGASPDVGSAWLQHWRSTWPAAEATSALDKMVRDIALQCRELAAAPPSATSENLLARLDRRLLGALRRNPLSPVAAVAFLGLTALDLARLRGAVAVRSLRFTYEGAA
jgi:hypothetical protein